VRCAKTIVPLAGRMTPPAAQSTRKPSPRSPACRMSCRRAAWKFGER